MKLFSYICELLAAYRTCFPKTKFIFNLVLLTQFRNKKFNELISDFSLDANSNLWYFDSHHIAATLAFEGYQVIETSSRRANGIHMT